MALPLTFTIPGNPRGKGRPRFVRATGRTYTDDATANAEAYVRMLASREMAGRQPFEGPVRLTMHAIFAPPKSWSKKRQAEALTGQIRPTAKPDASNVLKLAEDAMNGVVFHDDAQITDVVFAKKFGAQPMIVITVEAL